MKGGPHILTLSQLYENELQYRMTWMTWRNGIWKLIYTEMKGYIIDGEQQNFKLTQN